MTYNPKSANKIIWFLVGNPIFTASSRIHGMAVHRELVRIGYNSHIAYLPEFIEEEIPFDYSNRREFESLVELGDLIILQKIKNPINLELLNYFKQLELRLVLIDCDLPIAEKVSNAVDQVICTSKTLTDKYLKRNLKASFIEDCPELYSNSLKKKKETLECFWFGDNTPQKWNEVLQLEKIFKDDRLSRWRLVTISNHPDASIQWTPDFLDQLKSADVIALPIATDNDESSVKSANRLLQSMALSVPVICSPLASYTDIVTSEKDALVCSTNEEWIIAFQKLEDDKTREQIGSAGFVTAQKFSIEKTIPLWLRELDLEERFKAGNLMASNKVQTQLSNFFYRLLLKKNLFYWRKMNFSLSNLGWLGHCVALKLKKRLSI